jgi:two-component system response regulator FixJ
MPIVLISGHADVPMAVAAIKAGAEDMIEKPLDDAQLVAAINRCLAQQLQQRSRKAEDDQLARRYSRLTLRQLEVLDLVVAGLSSPEIAARLGISSRTVESYRSQIMERMQADSVAMLVRQVVQLKRGHP